MKIKPFLALTALLLCCGCSSVGILRREENIEASLLRATPIGSSRAAVLEYIKSKGWTDVRVNLRTGFWKYEPPKWGETIGVSSVYSLLGEYHSPFVTSVEGYWGFDANERLIGVWVRKSVDAL